MYEAEKTCIHVCEASISKMYMYWHYYSLVHPNTNCSYDLPHMGPLYSMLSHSACSFLKLLRALNTVHDHYKSQYHNILEHTSSYM